MKQFTYINDILNDKQFKILLDDAINEETHRRNCSLVVVRAQGLELRRNTFYHIELKGLLTVEGLTSEFKLIEAGQSKCSAHERHFIHVMVDDTIMNTLEYYKVNRITRFWKRIINKFKKWMQ